MNSDEQARVVLLRIGMEDLLTKTAALEKLLREWLRKPTPKD